MRLESFERIKRDENQDNLYDIFQTTVINGKDIELFAYTVTKENEMRIDKISQAIYNSNQYTEELMSLNAIVDPWSIKEGDVIYFCRISNLSLLYDEDDDYYKDIDKLVDKGGKETKLDPSRSNNLNPVVKPKNLKQINVDKNQNVIKIIDSFDD